MANLSSCDSDVLSEVPYSDTFQNDIMNQGVQELQYSKQSPIVDYPDNEITSDSNIIPYSQYLEETQHAIVQNTNTSAQQNSMIISMFEQMSNHATNWDKANNENKIVNESLTAELERYKEQVIILEQRFNVDLISREKLIDSQMDDMIRMKYKLNKLSEDFGKHFVPQQELSAEQMFWLQSINKNSEEPSTSNTHVKIEVPSELPKVSLVNKSFRKLRFHLASFDKVVKVRTKADVITEGSWGFEHTKKVFLTEIIPWLNKLKDFFKEFDNDRKCCEIQQKQFLIKNDRILDKIISQEIVNIVLNSSIVICDSEKKNDDYVGICNKCLELEAKFVKKNNVYSELSKRFSNLGQHCISLEVDMQLNQEIFQKDKSCAIQNDPEIQEYFEQNDLQAQLRVKDTIISKLKETIHSLRDNANPARVKKDIDEIEP
ncbi:hypothetical protein Tco_0910373 [Tanacetum coccineum]|uniref:Uncharacterized protein n=1 Tax=Tanacetum coccineum TaxID=301880 RepID=A0ABQ5CT17_9ASTR